MTKRTQKTPKGFTIVEVLIVIAVSALLLLSAVNLLSGDTTETEFNVAINNTKQQMEEIISSTANGFYATDKTYSCSGSGVNMVPPNVIYGMASTQGSNFGCIFLGNAILFNQNSSQFNIYPIVGNQSVGAPGGPDATTIYGAKGASPLVLNDPVTKTLEYGLKVHSVTSATGMPTSAVGFISGDSSGNIAAYDLVSGKLLSGAEPLSLYYDQISPLGILTEVGLNNDVMSQVPPPGGLAFTSSVGICLDGGNGKSGLITIGGDSNLSVSLTVWNSTTCT